MQNADHSDNAGPSRRNRLRAVVTSKTNRSAMTNRTTILANVDGRSPEGRRFRDLCMSFAEDLGGFEGISEEAAILVRQAASVTMQSEAMQGAVARGELVDSEQMVRLTNALTRTLNALKSRRKPRNSTPSIADIAARHREGAKA